MFLGTDILHFCRSTIPRSTIEAYLKTDYRIQGDWPLLLRIGRYSDELAALYAKYGVSCASVLTAWNPYSENRLDAENRDAQERLIGELDRLGLPHQPGAGVDPTGKWPPEDCRLVLGTKLLTARSLGRRYKQNGFVWVAADGEPVLVLLR